MELFWKKGSAALQEWWFRIHTKTFSCWAGSCGNKNPLFYRCFAHQSQNTVTGCHQYKTCLSKFYVLACLTWEGEKIACHEMGFRKNVTTWSVLKPWHDTFPQQSRQASKCFLFCHISNMEGNIRGGFLGVCLTFGEMSFSVVLRCLSVLIVLAALDCLPVPS